MKTVFYSKLIVYASVLLCSPTVCGREKNFEEVVNGVKWLFAISNREASVGGISVCGLAATGENWVIAVPSVLGGVPVTKIGDQAFSGYTNLRTVKIPEGVERLGRGAFESCSNLLVITIPPTVTEIGRDVFVGCANLSSICIEGDNRFFTSVGGCLYDKRLKHLRCCPPGKKSVEIPRGVEVIEEGAFAGCSRLEKVEMPGTIRVIGDFAFKSCSNLRRVTVQSGIVDVGRNAFADCDVSIIVKCYGYESVNLEKVKALMRRKGVRVDLEKISSYSVDDCDMLFYNPFFSEKVDGILWNYGLCDSSIILGGGGRSIWPWGRVCVGNAKLLKGYVVIPSYIGGVPVREVGADAFRSCGGLESIKIPNGVTRIGARAFSECDNLKRVMIPSGVKCIIQDAFSGCKSLKEVCVSKGGMKRVKEMLSQSGVNVDSLTFIECLE